MIHKKAVWLPFLLVLSMSSVTYANPLNVAKQGDKAVLFNFQGLGTLNLNTYQGGIGGKYFISDDLAIRGMLMLGVDNTTTNSTPQTSTSSINFGIAGGLEYHLPLASHISPYVGGQISFQDLATTNNPGAAKTSTTAFGLGAIGGVEYFFNNNLSLGAEYQFGFTAKNNSSSGIPSTDTFTLGFQTAGLTLAVYF